MACCITVELFIVNIQNFWKCKLSPHSKFPFILQKMLSLCLKPLQMFTSFLIIVLTSDVFCGSKSLNFRFFFCNLTLQNADLINSRFFGICVSMLQHVFQHFQSVCSIYWHLKNIIFFTIEYETLKRYVTWTLFPTEI